MRHSKLFDRKNLHMEKFQLELLFKIIGLGSASGLIFNTNSVIAIGDNASYLYEYQMETKDLKKYPLLENASETIAKKDKPDFECMTQYGNDIYIFGSGSTENRMKMVHVDAVTKNKIDEIDLTNLYLTMQSFAAIKPENFNIEGVIYDGTDWYFFNRGNGKESKNAIFTVSGKNLTEEFTVIYNPYKLPKIKSVETSFTDAVLVNNQIYFLATAEDTVSTYDDGQVLGSIIGKIDLKSMKVKSTKKISDSAKLEGLTVYNQSDKEITFLICEDNDTDEQESNIYKFSLKK